MHLSNEALTAVYVSWTKYRQTGGAKSRSVCHTSLLNIDHQQKANMATEWISCVEEVSVVFIRN